MARNEKLRDPVPKEFQTLDEAADFWDSHDLTDYEDNWKPVEIQVHINPPSVVVNLEPKLAEKVTAVAKEQHISTESLVNLALQEYLEKRFG